VSSQLLQVLVPMLTDRPKRRFNVFDVMHHGTHEKQLSNVFTWLLRPEGTHELGDIFQRILVKEVNRQLSETGRDAIDEQTFGVRQEVNTAPPGEGADIADIVLDGDQTTVVIENYFTADGHGHNYEGYAEHGRPQTARTVVVLLCEQEVRSALADGWQDAPVLLYGTLLDLLYTEVKDQPGWRRENPEQFWFLENMHRHFTNRMAVTMNRQGLIDFLDALCQADEASAFAGPADGAARTLADRLREEAIQRFEEGRELLGRVKAILRGYCEATLRDQVNAAMGANVLGDVVVNYRGIYAWTVTFASHPDYRAAHGLENVIHLVLGPTAWHEVNMGRWRAATFKPDYKRIVILGEPDGDRATQSDVTLNDVMEGLTVDDHRLRDDVVSLLRPLS